MGWAQRQRDLGALIFIDLRDRSGIVQLAFDENTEKAIFEKALTLKSEFVVSATGVVRERSSKNPDIPTGNIEIFVSNVRVLGESETPPFDITDDLLSVTCCDMTLPSLSIPLSTTYGVTGHPPLATVAIAVR